ncbi:MAG TPA: hypothetical protein VHK00_05345 [Miltoncostaeaceae bacterium]|nr:hypothetical protein [Miltoncostaeaceae bacterium]
MKFRRRYEVVVEGVSGQAVAQRSVISEHRTEEEAREAAELERARLEVIHGGGARSWRILVVFGEDVLAEVRPQATGEDLLRARAITPPRPERPEEPAAAGPDNGAAAATEPGEPAEPAEPPPEGPVPDWVIQRFEDSIERRGEREERGPGPAEDGAS